MNRNTTQEHNRFEAQILFKLVKDRNELQYYMMLMVSL